MAYHFNNKIEIIEERDDPNAFMLGENMITTVIAKPQAGIKTYNQVKYKGSKYNISSVTNDNVMNQTLTIFAVLVE